MEDQSCSVQNHPIDQASMICLFFFFLFLTFSVKIKVALPGVCVSYSRDLGSQFTPYHF